MNTFQKWLTLVQSQILNPNAFLTENDVIHFRKYIGHCGQATPETKKKLLEAFHGYMPTGGYQLTVEQQNKGTQYLLSKSLKKSGERRKGCKLGSYELGILQSGSVTHTLISLAPQYNGLGDVLAYTAVYRAEAGGKWFDYLGCVYEMSEVVGIGRRAA